MRKAESDYRLASRIARGREPFHNEQCFHCQQSAEEYLKALLDEMGLGIPRTHLLSDLLALLLPHYPSLGNLRRGLVFLTRFAVATRYPGDNATKRQSVASLRWADKVRQACRNILGLPLRSPHRKRHL